MVSRGCARRRLAFALTLAVVVAFGLAACGGGGRQRSSTDQSAQQNSQSSNQNGSQQSSTTQSGGNGSISQSSFSTREGAVQIYAGSSDAGLSVRLEKPSRLLWSNDKGQTFRLDGAGVPVDSHSGSGEAALSAGRHRLHVRGDVWTVVIRPR
jgi:hypothetical protein